MTTFNQLHDYINNIPIIDVHEHLMNDTMRLERFKDFISLVFSNYPNTSAVSSGLTYEEVAFLQSDVDVVEKVELYKRAV